MYETKNFTYILTSLEAIEKIFIYAKGCKSTDVFFQKNEQMNFNACQTLLLVIGEECKKIDKLLKAEYPNIPWHLVANLRNRIAHDYRGIDPNIAFDIIRNYLPSLKTTLVQMLDKVSFEKQLLDKVLKTPYYKHLGFLKK